MTLRIVLCARESAAPRWLAALEEALRSQGLAFELWWRDAQSTAVDSSARQADVALVWKPPAAFFDEQRALKLVFNLGAGVDALLALPNLPREAALVRLEDAGMADALSEYVLAAVLRAYRGFDRYAHQQAARDWRPLPLPDKREYRVGVLGLGVIGGAIAQRLAAHGFSVRGFARSERTLEGVDCRNGDLRDLDGAFGRFLDGLGVLVGVLPLTADTRGVLDARALSRLKRGAHLVNVGRGAHVVEADLLALLDSGQLGGATLDVFATEPLPPGHPFWSRPEILVTPHVSAVTEIAPSVAQISRKLAHWTRGEPFSGTVDLKRGY